MQTKLNLTKLKLSLGAIYDVFTPPRNETDWTYSTAVRTCMRQRASTGFY